MSNNKSYDIILIQELKRRFLNETDHNGFVRRDTAFYLDRSGENNEEWTIHNLKQLMDNEELK